MDFASTDTGLLVASAAGGVAVGLAAVQLAKVIPLRMEVSPRDRPQWWWALATLIGTGFGVAFAVTVGTWALLAAFLLFGAATLGIALIDLDHQLIPNRVLFPALGAGLVLLALTSAIESDWSSLLRGLAGGTAYFLILLFVGLVARGGFGMGDVKLTLFLGLYLGYLGWGVLVVGSTLAILLGGIASILLLVFTRRGRDGKFAYGPYLVAGAWISLLWGETLLDWYLGR